MFIEKMEASEKELLKNLCKDYKIFQLTEAEAKKEKEKTGKAIKTILDKYGYTGTETLDIYSIQYSEQKKRIPDSDKMKASGIFDQFSKEQITKPLTIR